MNTFIKNNNLLILENTLSQIPQSYFILNENEWVKAAHYNATLSNYSFYATQSNTSPNTVTANSVGDGSAGQSGNFANFANVASWGGVAGIFTTVGTNGISSSYGIYDGCGNINEWTEGISDTSRVRRGGSYNNVISGNAPNIGSRYFLNPTSRNVDTGLRIGSYIYPNSNFVQVGDINNPNHSTGFGSVSYSFFCF